MQYGTGREPNRWHHRGIGQDDGQYSFEERGRWYYDPYSPYYRDYDDSYNDWEDDPFDIHLDHPRHYWNLAEEEPS